MSQMPWVRCAIGNVLEGKSEANIISLKKGLFFLVNGSSERKRLILLEGLFTSSGLVLSGKDLRCECNEDFKSSLLVDFGIKVVTPKLIVIAH